jgi:pimeloyl-ACP methyl ester carboxylesterase
VYLQAIARALAPLENRDARAAFLHTLRAVIDVHGQRVSATDRLYLLESIPTLIVWGERDNTIPLQHGRSAHRAIPHSSFRTLPGAAHFPHLEDPDGLSELLRAFIAATEPGLIEDGDWGAILARRSPRSRRIGHAAA